MNNLLSLQNTLFTYDLFVLYYVSIVFSNTFFLFTYFVLLPGQTSNSSYYISHKILFYILLKEY